MKAKNVIVSLSLFLLFQTYAFGQSKDYRKDSLQFKMYTRLYVNEQLQVDSINVKKIFCDYCSEMQTEVLINEAIRQSRFEANNPKYRKTGEHRLALIVRFSKEDFKKLNDNK